MNIEDLKKLLPGVHDIARLAGTEIMKYYGQAHIYTKKDGSQVTDADLAAEAIVLPALRDLTPGIPIVSEERVAEGEAPDISAGTFWTVDPIDGTRSFIEKSDGFAVAIGLVVGHKSVFGLIYHPSLSTAFVGYGPDTAVRIGPDGVAVSLTELRPRFSSPRKHRALISGWWSDMARVDAYLAEHFEPGTVEKDVSNIGLFRACRVAIGEADLTVVCSNRTGGRIAFWDVVPGHAIVEAAGGSVKSFDGQPLLYTASDFYVGPHVMRSALA